MARGPCYLLVALVAAAPARAAADSACCDLALAAYHRIAFDDIPATRYSNEGSVLVANVERSAAFLFRPFAAARRVKSLRFSYRLDAGKAPAHRDPEFESTKAGEDFLFRAGVLVAGPAPMLPFLGPSWIRSLRDLAKLPADRIVFAVAGAAHPAAASWHSPYGDDIELHAAAESVLPDGWRAARLTLAAPVDTVGVWLMADGDDTSSSFIVRVKDLVLEP